MKKQSLVKIISIIFMLASFMGSMHHHKDMQTHSDCQICSLQHNVQDIDTPEDVYYLTLFALASEATVTGVVHLQTKIAYLYPRTRAPSPLS